MRLRFYLHIFILALLGMTASCSDDASNEIYLQDMQSNRRVTDGQTITLKCFRDHKFVVRGGQGNYSVSKTEGGNISYEWSHNRDTLILMANLPIDASITINDKVGDKAFFNIKAEYINNRYTVNKVSALIKGDNLLTKEARELENKVVNESNMKNDYTFIFIYDDEDNYHAGQLRITDTNSNKVGNNKKFVEDSNYISDKDPHTTYRKVKIYENGKQTTTYIFVEQREASGSSQIVKIMEDVTETYLTEYPQLEKAYAIYDVTTVLR